MMGPYGYISRWYGKDFGINNLSDFTRDDEIVKHCLTIGFNWSDKRKRVELLEPIPIQSRKLSFVLSGKQGISSPRRAAPVASCKVLPHFTKRLSI